MIADVTGLVTTALLHPSIVDQAGWVGEADNSPACGAGVPVGVRGLPVSCQVIAVAVRWYLRYGLILRVGQFAPDPGTGP
jgi:hypothetical protein